MPSFPSGSSGLAGLAALVLVACGGDHPDPSVETYQPVPGCEGIDHTPCDIRASTCQARLFGLAACLREDHADPIVPPVSVVSEADFGAIVAALALAAAPELHLDRWDWALSTLGLITRGALSPQARMAATVTSVGGIYRRDTKDVIIVDHGVSFDDQSASSLLVHEFVHALQDRQLDVAHFSATFSVSQDAALAAGAMVEGEARMHETRYRASALGLDPARVDWMRRFESAVALGQADLLKQPSLLAASAGTFSYELGARYVHHVWAAGGMASVEERFRSPPLTTRVLMASVDQALEPEAAPATIPAPVPPAEWSISEDATMGAWTVFLALAKGSPADAQAIALGWRGDGLWIYDGPEGQGALVWRIDFADEPTAARAASAFLTQFGSAKVRQLDTRIVVATSTDGAPVDWSFASP